MWLSEVDGPTVRWGGAPIEQAAGVMKARMAIKLIVVGGMIVAIGYFLRGHDLVTAVALSLLLVVVVAKVVAALVLRRRGGLPPMSGGGPDLGGRPVRRPPGGRPPELSAAAGMK